MAKVVAYRYHGAVSEEAWRSFIVKDEEAEEMIDLYRGKVKGWFQNSDGTPGFVVQVFDLEER